MKAWKRNRSRKSPSEPSTWQLHCHTLGFVVSPSCSERALIFFSVINKPVVIFSWLSTGFPPHVWRQTHKGCIYSSGRYCDPPDIRGEIILLLHLASCETLDKLSRSWKATRVSDSESRQSASRAQDEPGHRERCHHCSHLGSQACGHHRYSEKKTDSVRVRAPFIHTEVARNDAWSKKWLILV